MRGLAVALFGLGLVACAPTWEYIAPPGTSKEALESTRTMCVEEAGIERLGEERDRLEQQCMIERGYRVQAISR